MIGFPDASCDTPTARHGIAWPLAHGVRHLFDGVDFAREASARGIIERVACDLGQIDSHTNDHRGLVRAHRAKDRLCIPGKIRLRE